MSARHAAALAAIKSQAADNSRHRRPDESWRRVTPPCPPALRTCVLSVASLSVALQL